MFASSSSALLLPQSRRGSSCRVQTEARVRPGRQLLQRKHREDNLRSNQEALDALRLVGVDRVQCMLVYSKASEYLFYESNSADGEAGPEVLDREQVERVVTWLRSSGVPDAQIPAVLTSHPTLLAYDLQTRLQPLSEYLSSLGMKLMVDYLLSVDTPLDVVIERLLTTL